MSADLPKGNTELSKDPRPIRQINVAGDMQAWFVSHPPGIRIEAYDENGSMAAVPWIAVFRGDDIIARIPAQQVSIHY